MAQMETKEGLLRAEALIINYRYTEDSGADPVLSKFADTLIVRR